MPERLIYRVCALLGAWATALILESLFPKASGSVPAPLPPCPCCPSATTNLLPLVLLPLLALTPLVSFARFLGPVPATCDRLFSPISPAPLHTALSMTRPG